MIRTITLSEDVFTRLQALARPFEDKEPEAEVIVQEKSITTDELKTRLLKHLKSANMSLHAALNKSKKWDLKNKVLTLTFNSLFESSFVTRESF